MGAGLGTRPALDSAADLASDAASELCSPDGGRGIGRPGGFTAPGSGRRARQDTRMRNPAYLRAKHCGARFSLLTFHVLDRR